MPYSVRLVNCPIEFGTELSWLRLRMSLSESGERRDDHSQQESSLCARPGLLRLQGRLQVLPVLLPLAMAPEQHQHCLSERSAKEENRESVSKPSQTATISSSPQPNTAGLDPPLISNILPENRAAPVGVHKEGQQYERTINEAKRGYGCLGHLER